MKRTYIICLFFIISIIVFSSMYLMSKENSIPEYNITSTEQTSQALNQISYNKEIRINNLTKFKLQILDLSTNTFKEKKINTQVYMLGFTRDDLLKYLGDYMKELPVDEQEKGLISYELILFTQKEVVLRKTYTGINTEKYYGTIENGYIVIYDIENQCVYDYTNISFEILPENIKEAVKNRIYFPEEKDLYEFLQTYSS